jgi:hypothetical protein
MRHLAAFNQIRRLGEQFEYLWLENEFYKTRLKSLGINESDLSSDLQAYQADNKSRAEAARLHRFGAAWMIWPKPCCLKNLSGRHRPAAKPTENLGSRHVSSIPA